MHRLHDHLGGGDGGRVERRASPGDLDWEPGEIDDRAVPAVAAQVEGRAHEDAIDRAGLDTQRAEHALRIIDREPAHAEALAPAHPLLADVDAIHRTRLRTLVASDAGRQIVAMEAAVTGRHRRWQFGVFEVFGEGPPLLVIGAAEHAQRDQHALRNRADRREQVPKPFSHGHLFEPGPD